MCMSLVCLYKAVFSYHHGCNCPSNDPKRCRIPVAKIHLSFNSRILRWWRTPSSWFSRKWGTILLEGAHFFISMIIGERVVRACHLWNHFCNTAFLFCDFECWILHIAFDITLVSKKDVYEFIALCHDFLDLFHLWRCALFSCNYTVRVCMTSRKSHQEISGVYDQIPSGHPHGFPFGKIQRQNTVARYAPNGKLSRVSPRLHHLSFLKCFTCEVLDLAQKNETHNGVAFSI